MITQIGILFKVIPIILAYHTMTSTNMQFDGRHIHRDRFEEPVNPTSIYIPGPFTHDMEQKMRWVEEQSPVKRGKWYSVKCINIDNYDDIEPAAIGNYYIVYYPVDSRGDIVSASIAHMVAAPCPPFCHDEENK